MIKVHVCDDVHGTVAYLAETVEKMIKDAGYKDVEIGFVDKNPVEFMSRIRQNECQKNIYILDYQFRDYSMDANKIIDVILETQSVLTGDQNYIILVTGYDAVQVPRGSVYRLIFKSVFGNDNDIKDTLAEIIPQLQATKEWVDIGGHHVVKDAVFSVQSGRRNTITIKGKSESMEGRGSLKMIEEQYPGYLLRCTREVLVNPAHIDEIDIKQRVVYLDNGGWSDISFRCLPGVEKWNQKLP